MIDFDFYPKKIFKLNIYLILLLILASTLGILMKYYFDYAPKTIASGLINLFDVDKEQNIPTLYSSIALLVASILLALIANTHRKIQESYIPWFILSLTMLFLAIDETASIHERFSGITQSTLNTTGYFYVAWIIPVGISVIIFGISYIKFLFRLPKETMVLFLISGFIFVLGAIGFEMFEGEYVYLHGEHLSLLFSFYTTVEEFLEMLGIAIFNYALLSYIVNKFEALKIGVSKK